MELNNDQQDGSSSLELLLRLSWPVPCIETTSIRNKRWVIIIGVSLLKGIEDPICKLTHVFGKSGAFLG